MLQPRSRCKTAMTEAPLCVSGDGRFYITLQAFSRRSYPERRTTSALVQGAEVQKKHTRVK
uniref:Uncharacterized protein n=1 Tax=Anguilla anguilla TaxID=7936 RepID=A0A0E9XB54_ANGAN